MFNASTGRELTDDTSTFGWQRSVSVTDRRGAVAPKRARIASRLGKLSGVTSLAAGLDAERDRLFLWVPVSFGCGIALYFSLPREPALTAVLLVTVVTGIIALRAGYGRMSGAAFLGLFLASLGLTDASLRNRWIAAPVIAETGRAVPVTGRVAGVEHREDGAARLFVAPERIGSLPETDLPRTVSLWLRGNWAVPAPGETVGFNAVLLPPPDAAVPGGFDYARQAWFAGIGGVGFITSPPERRKARTAPGYVSGLATAIERLRLSIAERIQEAVPGSAGTVAAALVTGERGAIPETDKEALRASGLAHILAISGLHMMLVVGTLFWATRAAFALSPGLALHKPIKKWAAVIALSGGAGYLVLSGASIATQRAFIMAAIMLVAVLLDRPAITLRNVAIAAMIVLVMTPEALVTASFQMSFAATVALVSSYEALRAASVNRTERATPPWLRFIWRAGVGLVLTALIAGLATGPFAAFHFNRVAVYGLVANVAAMPLVSVLVMPAGLAAVCLMPFGLEGPALAVMGLGIEGVLSVAQTVSGWDGAVRMVPQMPMAVLLVIVSGGLWLTLWRGGIRLLGLPLIAAGLAATVLVSPPDLFVSRDVRMAALRTGEGLVFLPRAGSDYEVEVWQRAAGVIPDPTGGERSRCDKRACVAGTENLRVSYVIDPMAFSEDCGWADVIVTPLVPPDWCRGQTGRPTVIGPGDAVRSGAMTLTRIAGGLRIDTAAAHSGDRPWTRRNR